jgi:hypothetical protein
MSEQKKIRADVVERKEKYILGCFRPEHAVSNIGSTAKKQSLN